LPSATAAFGLASIASDHADFPALEVLNHIIGSGDFDAVLTEEIRVKRGLAYSVQTALLHDSITSLLLGAFSTKNDTMESALGVLKEVLVKTARDGPNPGQFENAKRYLTGSFLLDFDTNAKVASSLLGIWVDGEGPDYLKRRNQKINAVTLADVKRVARDVLKADALSVTIVGKPRL
jgi:zinc protease